MHKADNSYNLSHNITKRGVAPVQLHPDLEGPFWVVEAGMYDLTVARTYARSNVSCSLYHPNLAPS